jgi:hypothetical protein
MISRPYCLQTRTLQRVLKNFLIVGFAVLQAACSVVGIRSEETPNYKVLLTEGNKEIRSYSSYIVAKTTVKGEFRESQSEAFRILAGYIFGKNEKKQKLSMTAPVVQSQKSESEKLSMTAPVVQTASTDGWTMTFMMPSKYKLEELPTPTDNRVTFEVVPEKLMAVIRYSGVSRDSLNNEMSNELSQWLGLKSEYTVASGPSFAGYDPPWTIPFFRRNEAMIDLHLR